MIIAEITGGKPGEIIEIPSTEKSDEVFTYDNDPKVLAAFKLTALINKSLEKFKGQEEISTLDIAQFLTEHGVIVPPCKAGDTVYSIVFDKIMVYEIEEIRVDKDGVHICVVGDFDKREYMSADFFEAVCYTSYEAAEKALKERTDDKT